MHPLVSSVSALLVSLALATSAMAHDKPHGGGIATPATQAVKAPFDIVHTKVTTEGNVAVFHMAVSGQAGKSRPSKSGKLAGSTVFSYVWPTSLDPAVIGFEPKAGILAFGTKPMTAGSRLVGHT